MSEKEYKKINLELKEANEKGQVKAVFSVFNDVDSDGDVVLPTSIKSGLDPNGEEVPMVWAHDWSKPIGRGKIVKDDEKAIFDGSFFMDTESGQEAYKLVKNMGALQQWSFGFRVEDSEYGKFKKSENDDETDVRYLKELSVYEVSPVLVGANQDTFTMAIKSLKETDDVSDEVSDSSNSCGCKGVLGHSSFQSEEGSEEDQEDVEQKDPVALMTDHFTTEEEAVQRARILGCSGSHSVERDGKTYYMPCNTHEQYEMSNAKHNDTLSIVGEIAKELKELLKEVPTDQAKIDLLKELSEKIKIVTSENEILEKSASVQGKRFSDEVKDALAALNNLVARVQSIGELRAKNGRKLGVSATEALRTVQESVQDAFDELDKFVDEFGSEGALETETQVVDEEITEEVSEQVEPEATAEVLEETAETEVEVSTEDPAEEPEDEVEAEEPLVEETADETPEDNIVEVDDELDNLWVESQQVIYESTTSDVELIDLEGDEIHEE